MFTEKRIGSDGVDWYAMQQHAQTPAYESGEEADAYNQSQFQAFMPGYEQQVSVTDKKTPTPRVPQTGGTTPLVAAVILLSLLGCVGIFFFRMKRVRV